MGATDLDTTSASEPGDQPRHLINRNLISLKVVLFLAYGGLACLYSTLIPHMLHIGLNYNESRIILIVAPLISIIGPLLFAPLADRLASKKQALSGQYLRVLIATAVLLAAIVYACLLAVPSVSRSASRRPQVSFGCDAHGAIIFQERCSDEKTCYHWAEKRVGSLALTNCSYTCQNPTQFEQLYSRPPGDLLQVEPSSKELLSRERSAAAGDYENEDYNEGDAAEVAAGGASAEQRTRRQVENGAPNVEPPHLCELVRDADGTERVTKCHAFTPGRRSIEVRATLRSATNLENDTHSAEWCTYPLDGFQCQVPQLEVNWMKLYLNNDECKPMVECEVLEPYDSPDSVLAESQCVKVSDRRDSLTILPESKIEGPPHTTYTIVEF